MQQENRKVINLRIRDTQGNKYNSSSHYLLYIMYRLFVLGHKAKKKKKNPLQVLLFTMCSLKGVIANPLHFRKLGLVALFLSLTWHHRATLCHSGIYVQFHTREKRFFMAYPCTRYANSGCKSAWCVCILTLSLE